MVTLDCTVESDRSPWLCCTVQLTDRSPWLHGTVQWVWTGRCGNVVLYSGCGLVAVVTVYCTVMDGDSPVSSMRY